MKKTTRLKKPQIPELDTLYQFDDLGGRPKYGGVEMTSETDIPSFQEIMDETHSAVVAEATARDDADEELQAQIDSLDSDLTAETTAREAADQAEATARAAADQAETTARTSADNNLQTQIDAIVASSDVKDIVGTYAELQAYDTSTLGDNDIIKVLQDESHDDETTYYRWSTSTSTFTLIGAEGPYYTKSATDTLLSAKADKVTTYTKTEVDTALSAKQDNLTAGTNVQINGTTISATDTTYSNFTGTDGIAAGVAGLVPAPATTDAGKVLGAGGTWVTGGPTVVQTTGNSTTDVMSQEATTKMVLRGNTSVNIRSDGNYSAYTISIGNNSSAGDSSAIAIGGGSTLGGAKATGIYSIAIGSSSNARGKESVAIGHSTCSQEESVSLGHQAGSGSILNQSAINNVYLGHDAGSTSHTNHDSVALGHSATFTRNGEVNVGAGSTTNGFNKTSYRVIGGVHDPVDNHDAATKGYVDGLVGNVAAALNAINNGSN